MRAINSRMLEELFFSVFVGPDDIDAVVPYILRKKASHLPEFDNEVKSEQPEQPEQGFGNDYM